MQKALTFNDFTAEERAVFHEAMGLLLDPVMLGPVVLTRDDTGDRAEMEEPAARFALTGSTPVEVVAGARFELATFGL